MELNQQNRNFSTSTIVLDTVAEQLADVDFTLPDYCPDIEKILKCTLTPKVQSKNLSGGQLRIDGYCIVNVLYVENINKTIRCCEQSVSFSQCFTVKETPDNAVIITKTKQEYINCRALSPRRLVMHGAFSLYAKVFATDSKNIYVPDNENLECLKKAVRCADLKAFCQEQFNVCEEINVADKPKIESILYSTVTATIIDSKAVTGKLMVNGETNISIFYLCNVETGESGKIDYVIPFNQIIDCEGVDENTVNCIQCSIMSYDLRLKNDLVNENPSIVVDIKICVSEEGYILQDEEIICDAYSVKYAVGQEKEQVSMLSEIQPINETFIQKMNIHTDDGKISKVLDIYCDSVTSESRITDKGAEVFGKINICMLALNNDEYPIFIDRTAEYEHPVSQATDCNALKNINSQISSVSYRMSADDEVEIRCELKVNAVAIKEEQYEVIKSIEVYEDKELPCEKCALTLYYASKGENLWNIAKSHRTKLDMLLEENSTEQMALENEQMLLIPRV